jgi:hypothetical protein
MNPDQILFKSTDILSQRYEVNSEGKSQFFFKVAIEIWLVKSKNQQSLETIYIKRSWKDVKKVIERMGIKLFDN